MKGKITSNVCKYHLTKNDNVKRARRATSFIFPSIIIIPICPDIIFAV